MLDWFASKTGLLIFVIAAVAVLLAFANTQLGIMDTTTQVQAANTLANILDSMCEGCNTTLVFDRVYPITITSQKVSVAGTERTFLAQAIPVNLTAGSLKIYRTGGIVYVQKP